MSSLFSAGWVGKFLWERLKPGPKGSSAEARRVQLMVEMKPASSPRAATRHPAKARCRAEARGVRRSMVKMKSASSPKP